MTENEATVPAPVNPPDVVEALDRLTDVAARFGRHPDRVPANLLIERRRAASIAVDRALSAERTRADRLDALLRRIRQWDHLDGAGDGPYWKHEIDAVLDALPRDAA